VSTCRDCEQLTGKRYARYCDAHRWRHRGKPSTYRLTPEREAYLRLHYKPTGARGMSFRIAKALQVPKWRICRWAAELGLTSKEGRKGPLWTPEQDAFLEKHLASRHINWIAKQLGRSISACHVRAKRLDLSRRAARDWYTAHDVALGFGVDSHAVLRWIERGQLPARREGQDHEDGRACMWRISMQGIRRFLREHPAAFVLAKVDQVWFLDLVFARQQQREAA
jgi:hypothetical protein